jgi:hypothetical protein
VLRIFRPKRDENHTHSGELHNFFSLPNVSRKVIEDEMGRSLVGKPEANRKT